MSQIKFHWLYLIILVTLVFICSKLYFDYSPFLILCEEDEDEIRRSAVHNIQEGSVEFKNVKVTGLKAVAESLGQPVAFSAGVAGIVKLLKTTNLPLSSKIALTLGVGAGSLATFSLARIAVQKIDNSVNKEITAEISDVSVKAVKKGGSGGFDSVCCSLESADQLLSELVSTLFFLQAIIVYLLIQLLIVYTMKQISSADFRFVSVRSWFYGEKIQRLLIRSMSMWSKTSNFWIYFIIVFLIIFSSVSTFGVYAVLVSLSF